MLNALLLLSPMKAFFDWISRPSCDSFNFALEMDSGYGLGNNEVLLSAALVQKGSDFGDPFYDSVLNLFAVGFASRNTQG